LSTEGGQGLVDRLGERVEEKVAEDPFRRDESFIESMLPLLELWCRYFDARVTGFETLPPRGPMLLVGNHSGAPLVPDTAATMLAWYRERGVDDPLFGLALDGSFGIPGFETLMRKIGQLPASHENAEKALRQGHALLVYPGGAKEAFRPWTDRNRIDFAGHRGFARLALRTGVPVVPVVAHGGHHSTFVLSRGDDLAKTLRLDRLHLSVAPLLLQVPWGLSLGLLPGVPLPARIRVELGPPLDWSAFGPDAADDPAIVDRCYDEITTQMQHTLDRLARETPYPVAQRLLGLLPFARGGSDADGDGS
jgi:1-acyl-sn-glycerol-3-phosphate acyltransferase